MMIEINKPATMIRFVVLKKRSFLALKSKAFVGSKKVAGAFFEIKLAIMMLSLIILMLVII